MDPCCGLHGTWYSQLQGKSNKKSTQETKEDKRLRKEVRGLFGNHLPDNLRGDDTDLTNRPSSLQAALILNASIHIIAQN